MFNIYTYVCESNVKQQQKKENNKKKNEDFPFRFDSFQLSSVTIFRYCVYVLIWPHIDKSMGVQNVHVLFLFEIQID